MSPQTTDHLEEEAVAGARANELATTLGLCVPHAPIRITEDFGPGGFEWTDPETGERAYRPGSGVSSGEGTEADPYVITGWCITPAQSDKKDGIRLENTNAHVVITNTFISSPEALSTRPYVTYPPSYEAKFGIRALRVTNASFQNNTISNLGGVGLSLRESSDIVVRDNNISNVTDTAILLTRSSTNRVLGNHVERSYHGIRAVAEGVGTVFEANHIQGTVWWSLYIRDSSSSIVLNNSIQGDGELGISIVRSPAAIIQDNLIRGQERGIMVSASEETIVRRNTVLENWGGIDLNSAHGSMVVNNTVLNSYNPGISLWNTTGSTIARNLIEGSQQGIELWWQSDGNGVHNNTIQSNWDGIQLLYRSRFNKIENNTIEQNPSEGIILGYKSRHNHIAYNSIRNNGYGIEVFGASGWNIIFGNHILDNADSGISVSGSRELSIAQNTLDGNGPHRLSLDPGAGILLRKSPGTEVKRNEITASPAGVLISGGEDVRVHSNNLWDNHIYGLYAERVTDPVQAQENWWGCPEGPGASECDDAQGPVITSPYLSTRSESAGAPWI